MALTEKLASRLIAENAGDPRESEALRAALAELERERPERARRLALAVLDREGRSIAALAVWLEAADAMGLEAEVRDAAVKLSARLPQRGDLWWRLSVAEQRLGGEARAPAERALGSAEARPAALAAARWLFRDALDRYDVARAEGLAQHLRFGSEALENTHLDLAELELDQGHREAARRRLRGAAPPALLDARGWLTVARAAATAEAARRPFQRALLVGTVRLVRAAGSHACLAPELISLGRPLVEALGCADTPEWTLAAALGAADTAASNEICARQAKETPEPAIAWIWLRVALATESRLGLRQAGEFAASHLELANHPLRAEAERLLASFRARAGRARLAALDAPFAFAGGWAQKEREREYASWLERGAWDEVIDELARDLPAGLEGPLSAARRGLDEVRGPCTIALVGEFNAGKSSLVNALLGEQRAPVGVVPTTSGTAAYPWQGLRLLDTPGFNAPGRPDGESALSALRACHGAGGSSTARCPFATVRPSACERFRDSACRFGFWRTSSIGSRLPKRSACCNTS